ncbi:MAG: GAF domain-containing protein [Candidatus Cloacimonetes bacterium]|nr:GAF domain-containing protein [Candidatus Cloacimonadota bacterium]
MKARFSDNKEVDQMLNRVVHCITDLTEKQVMHIQRLTQIGLALSSETDLQKTFDMILEEAIDFTNADAATIYRVSEDGMALEFEIVYNRSLGLRMGGTHEPVNWRPVLLFDESGNPRVNHIVSNVYHTKQSLCFEDVYKTTEYDISGTIATDRANNYRCKSILTIPLKNHEDEVLGVIQVINALDKRKRIISFSEEHKSMLTSLASQAAIALSNRKLIQSLETLLMQFMRSIALGIERKSKYSSDHIQRVATLTDMIAQRMNDDEEGQFRGFRFTDPELKELSMAGWMHDVGKIITPEFVMDKSTKLETIFDRIDLVKTRFEMMQLSLELLQKDVSGEDFDAFIHSHFPAGIDKTNVYAYLQESLAFVERVNIGGEFLPDSDLRRLDEIHSIRFEYKGIPMFLIQEEEKINLQIRRGTLTQTEIKQMSAHVTVTWEMLSQLSFPKKYKNVAFYASTHHEKLNGKGYPWGLTAEKLPIQSRIIAVADIFEALTSADRPYKKPKTLSESLKIMAFCVKDGDLDASLLDFLLDSGLYLEFAKRFMHQDYIDEVNIPALKKLYHPEMNT